MVVNPEVKRVLKVQAALVVAATLLGSLLAGGALNVPMSVLLGGLTALLPAIVYARIAYARRHVPPAVLIKAHFMAEGVKFGLTVLMFGAVWGFFKDLSVVGYFGGFVAAIAGYWVGLLIK